VLLLKSTETVSTVLTFKVKRDVSVTTVGVVKTVVHKKRSALLYSVA
jgi:hypothetical protein